MKIPDLYKICVRNTGGNMAHTMSAVSNTHLGGSLYAMTDPFFMLMLIHILGKEFLVWDKAARIDFIKPDRGTVFARFLIQEE